MSPQKQIDILKSVKKNANIQAFPGLANAWHWSVARGRFNFVLVPTSDGKHAFQVNTRDNFDSNIVRSVLDFALKHETEALKADPLAILSGFAVAGSGFDTVISVHPSICQLHKANDPELSDVTYLIFPAYRCEYSGRETAKEAILRTGKMVDPADLSREPRPVVRMRFSNTKTGVRSVGDQRAFIEDRVLFTEITKLENALGSYIEFENYLGRVRKITWEDGFVLWDGDNAEKMTLDELVERVRQILLHEAGGSHEA